MSDIDHPIAGCAVYVGGRPYEPEPEVATELEWLRFFFEDADFGPADDDVRYIIEERFKDHTGKELPEGYRRGEEE